MTHFVGFVVAPEDVDLDALLAPFDENRETPRFMRATRAQLVEEARKSIADRTGPGSNYEAFWRDPAAYIQEHCIRTDGKLSNPGHVNYLTKELPEQLTYNDEQLYEHAVSFEDDLDEQGNAYSTYNPDSIWDWWVVGGRWDGEHAPGNRTTVAEYRVRIGATDYVPPRVLVDADGAVRRGTEGWFGMTHDEQDDAAWRGAVLDRLTKHPDDDVVTFIDLHI